MHCVVFMWKADKCRLTQSLARELYLLKSLSHKNIMKPIGFVEDTEDGIAWIILPWENNGNLREFIQSADWEFQERVALVCRVYHLCIGLISHNYSDPRHC